MLLGAYMYNGRHMYMSRSLQELLHNDHVPYTLV